MVNATLAWSESNANATQYTNVSFSNWGNVASASLDPVANPITPGSVAFEKYHAMLVTLNDSTKVSDFKFFFSGTEPANTSLFTNATEGVFTAVTVGNWLAPTASDSLTGIAVATATPAGANFGIAGSTTASLLQGGAGTNTTGATDYFIHTVITAAGATTGPAAAYTLHCTFDEVR